jgi:hypothetical protein
LFDDDIEHLLFFGVQAAVGENAVLESILITLWCASPALGRLGLALVPVPAVKVLHVSFNQSQFEPCSNRN